MTTTMSSYAEFSAKIAACVRDITEPKTADEIAILAGLEWPRSFVTEALHALAQTGEVKLILLEDDKWFRLGQADLYPRIELAAYLRARYEDPALPAYRHLIPCIRGAELITREAAEYIPFTAPEFWLGKQQEHWKKLRGNIVESLLGLAQQLKEASITTEVGEKLYLACVAMPHADPATLCMNAYRIWKECQAAWLGCKNDEDIFDDVDRGIVGDNYDG